MGNEFKQNNNNPNITFCGKARRVEWLLKSSKKQNQTRRQSFTRYNHLNLLKLIYMERLSRLWKVY